MTSKISTKKGSLFLVAVFLVALGIIYHASSAYQVNLNQLSAVFKTAPRAQLADVSSSLSNGLVGYWTFDEGSGTTANDSSGNGNNGTLATSQTWVTGSEA